MEQRRGIVVFAVDDEPLEAIERRAVDRFQDCHDIDQPEAGPKQENLGARTRVDDRAVKLIRSQRRRVGRHLRHTGEKPCETL